ncbi:MAG TPA: HAD family phosphatase [Treponemataceae bacterium]|nr:HAD family phosphatase [Treponemataceae bacterium]
MKAIIFDMDGVLIDSEPLHVLADSQAFQKLNIELPEGYLDKYVGVSDSAMWKELILEFDIEKDLKEILNMQLSTKMKLLKKSSLTAIDGIKELLQELYSQSIPIAVASSSPTIFIKTVLKKIRLEKYFSLIVSGEDVRNGKPEPDIFLKTAEILGVEPEDCVVIEDSKNGVIAAKRASMKCIGYAHVDSAKQDVSKADLIVSSIRDLSIQSIDKIENKQIYKKFEQNID